MSTKKETCCADRAVSASHPPAFQVCGTDSHGHPARELDVNVVRLGTLAPGHASRDQRADFPSCNDARALTARRSRSTDPSTASPRTQAWTTRRSRTQRGRCRGLLDRTVSFGLVRYVAANAVCAFWLDVATRTGRVGRIGEDESGHCG